MTENNRHLIVHLKKEENWLYILRKWQIGCKFQESGKLAVNLKKESINLGVPNLQVVFFPYIPDSLSYISLTPLPLCQPLFSLSLTPSTYLLLPPYPYLPPSSSSLLSTLHLPSSSERSLNILLSLPSPFFFDREI